MLVTFEKFFWFIYFKIYTLRFISDYVTKVLLVDLSFLSFLLVSHSFLGNVPELIFQLLCWNFFVFTVPLNFYDLVSSSTRYHILTSCMASVPYVSLWEVSLCVLEVGFLLLVLCLCALFLWVDEGFLFSVLCLCALFLWVPLPFFILCLCSHLSC